MEHDIIRVADANAKPILVLTPDGKLRGPLVRRLVLFFILNTLVAGLIGALGGFIFRSMG